MNAKRWSPLWVFAGGCLTGAALIGLHSRSELEPASSHRVQAWSDLARSRTNAGIVEDRDSAELAAAARALREVPARDVPHLDAAARADSAERDKTDAGSSVADVLARLETEYRQQRAALPAQASALAGTAEVPRPPSHDQRPDLAQEQSAVSEVSSPKPPPNEYPTAVRAAAPPAEIAPSDARLAGSEDDRPSPSAEKDSARLVAVRDDGAKAAFDSGQQQIAQMQQLAALQQAALVEQFTLLQLQLLSLSPVRPPTVPTRAHRQARGGRIVASLPSSISDTDNPWGFDLPPSVLVR